MALSTPAPSKPGPSIPVPAKTRGPGAGRAVLPASAEKLVRPGWRWLGLSGGLSADCPGPAGGLLRALNTGS